MIIGLVGEKLAGKDTGANYLAEKYGAEHFRFSNILDSILEELNLPISRKNEVSLGLGLRKIFGAHVLVNALEKRLKKSWAKLIVVNGIRMDEMAVVKSWQDAKIIYITAPPQVRFERYKNRHEKADDAVMDFEQFVKQDAEPTEVGIPELGKSADFKIENTGSLSDLYKKLDEILSKFKI